MADLKIEASERNKLIEVFSKDPAFLDLFVEPSSWPTSLQFSKDGKRILCGFENGAIRLWNLSDKELIYCLDHLGNVMCVSFLPSGRFALSGSKYGGLILWDLKSGKEKRR